MINIFDVAAGKVAQTLEGHAMSVRSLCFSPDSQHLLTASDDGHMKIYDVYVQSIHFGQNRLVNIQFAIVYLLTAPAPTLSAHFPATRPGY